MVHPLVGGFVQSIAAEWDWYATKSCVSFSPSCLVGLHPHTLALYTQLLTFYPCLVRVCLSRFSCGLVGAVFAFN
jgi:hypothetical protein